MEELFTTNREKINKFINRLETEEVRNLKLENIDAIKEVLNDMANPEKLYMSLDFNLCKFNIKHVGNRFIDSLESNNIEKEWDHILSHTVRFSKEIELLSDTHIESVHKLLTIYESKKELSNQIYYALRIMPYRIVNNEIIQGQEKYKKEVSEHIDDILTNKLPNKKKEIEYLKKDCDNYSTLLKGFKQEFSFLALNQAFNKLERSKQVARIITFLLLIVLAFIIVYVPYFYYEKSFLIEQITKVYNLTLNKDNIFILFSGLIPMIFIESIFIYYFKIVLNKYNSITDQIVQLETKQAIMQFIESYVDYKKDKGLKTEDLSKFEDIIFSQISPNLKDIPNSPDLVSIIESISKAVKGK